MKREIILSVPRQLVLYTKHYTRGVYLMIKKLTSDELIDLLISRNKGKYRYELNMLKNVGNPDLAITEMWGYSIDNDIAIVSVLCFGGCSVYFEIPDAGNLKLIHNEIDSTIKRFKEVQFSSDSNEIFQNSEFIRLFGKHDVNVQEQYGMINFTEGNKDKDEHVRVLTSEDEALIKSFQEPIIKYHNNLMNVYQTKIKTPDENYLVYGYIDEEAGILGYLITNTLDRRYWDISYIYVLDNMRMRGIAKNCLDIMLPIFLRRGCLHHMESRKMISQNMWPSHPDLSCFPVFI